MTLIEALRLLLKTRHHYPRPSRGRTYVIRKLIAKIRERGPSTLFPEDHPATARALAAYDIAHPEPDACRWVRNEHKIRRERFVRALRGDRT